MAISSRGMMKTARFCLAGTLAMVGCSSSPANVAGSYTVDITDEANGCGFADFDQGSSASDIPVSITQSSSSVTITVMGLAAITLDTGLGTAVFAGTVSGDTFNATIVGDKTFGSGGCAYTLNAAIEGSLDGDAISGTIDYTSLTNSSSACGSITGCETTQDYSGTRPPS
jgi:hypothetical protein